MESTVFDERAHFAVLLIGEIGSDSEKGNHLGPTAKP